MASIWNLNMLLLLFVSGLVSTQAKYTDPDSPTVEAAARAALPRAKVLDIKGITTGIQSVLQDLGAKVTAHEVKIELDADVLFDFDKYNLKPEATESLKKVSQVLQSYAQAPLLIEGHTDGMGTHAHNMKLSDGRAASVKHWLVQNAAVPENRITTRGWGETKPVAPNKNPNGTDNPAGRQKNRRVELTLRTS
jgi:outer membrane protein OmpA-like peptidoglycan-associated protein